MAADLDNVGLLFAGMGQIFRGLDHEPLVAELRDPAGRGARLRQRGGQPAAVRRLLRRPSDHPRPRGASTGYSTAAGADHRAGHRGPLRGGRRLGPAPARPRRRDALPLRVRQPLPAQGVQRRPASGQLPVPARRPRHLPRLRAGQALHRRRDRALRRHDQGDGHRPRPAPVPPGRRGHRAAPARHAASPTTRSSTTSATSTTSCCEDEPYTITPEYASETVRRFFDTTGPYGEIRRRPTCRRSWSSSSASTSGCTPVRRAARHRQLAAAGRGAVAVRGRSAVDADGRGHRGLATLTPSPPASG